MAIELDLRIFGGSSVALERVCPNITIHTLPTLKRKVKAVGREGVNNLKVRNQLMGQVGVKGHSTAKAEGLD